MTEAGQIALSRGMMTNWRSSVTRDLRAMNLLLTPPLMYRRPVSVGAFPVYQVVLWDVAVGIVAQVISGAARLG